MSDTTIPNYPRIFLQPNEAGIGEHTWCQDRINETDIEYVRSDSAKYWEAQASMWHEKYKDALRHEDDAKRYRDALLRIKDGYNITKERLRFIVTRALQVDGES
jgi:hypothetical protein